MGLTKYHKLLTYKRTHGVDMSAPWVFVAVIHNVSPMGHTFVHPGVKHSIYL